MLLVSDRSVPVTLFAMVTLKFIAPGLKMRQAINGVAKEYMLVARLESCVGYRERFVDIA